MCLCTFPRRLPMLLPMLIKHPQLAPGSVSYSMVLHHCLLGLHSSSLMERKKQMVKIFMNQGGLKAQELCSSVLSESGPGGGMVLVPVCHFMCMRWRVLCACVMVCGAWCVGTTFARLHHSQDVPATLSPDPSGHSQSLKFCIAWICVQLLCHNPRTECCGCSCACTPPAPALYTHTFTTLVLAEMAAHAHTFLREPELLVMLLEAGLSPDALFMNQAGQQDLLLDFYCCAECLPDHDAALEGR